METDKFWAIQTSLISDLCKDISKLADCVSIKDLKTELKYISKHRIKSFLDLNKVD